MQSAWTKTFNQLSNPARPKNCANYSTLQGYIIIEKNKVSQAKQARQKNGNYSFFLSMTIMLVYKTLKQRWKKRENLGSTIKLKAFQMFSLRQNSLLF